MKYEVGRGADNRAVCTCVASNPMLFLRSLIFFSMFFFHCHFCDKCFGLTFTHLLTLLVHHFGLKMHLSKVTNSSVVMYGTCLKNIWFIFFSS